MNLQAAIFDMDGVVTDTAKVHCIAWRDMFNDFLQQYYSAAGDSSSFQPFTDQDYIQFVDGKPRLDGIKSFLSSRSIQLELGSVNDDTQAHTVHGLAKNKNTQFTSALQQDGVEIFEHTVNLIRELRSQGIKTAIVSSSKNCEMIIEKAGLTTLFDARVDGTTLDAKHLNGKPHPDMFCHASEIIGVKPKQAIVFEDAISGVQAGSAGHFGLVVGIDRSPNQSLQLNIHGADWVISDLGELNMEAVHDWFDKPRPSALDAIDTIKNRAQGKKIALFLDYDGTLTPIVATPDLAVLSDDMRVTLQQTAQQLPLGIISGRMLEDLQSMVQIEELYYAGNHGFEITGPDNTTLQDTWGDQFLNDIEAAYKTLATQLSEIQGLLIEHKKYSLSVHFRLVDDARVDEIEKIVDEVIAEHPKLRKHFGKKVFEIRPAMDWHKGKALLHLLQTLELSFADTLPIYIGDDVTDEDAFTALQDNGIGILVSDQPQATRAHFSLREPSQVQQFMAQLIQI